MNKIDLGRIYFIGFLLCFMCFTAYSTEIKDSSLSESSLVFTDLRATVQKKESQEGDLLYTVNIDKGEPFEKLNAFSIECIAQLAGLVYLIRQEDPESKILIAYDWDRTISYENGSHYPFREGKLTKSVVEYLFNSYGALPFILTSRFEGEKSDEIFDSIIMNAALMKESLPIIRSTPVFDPGMFWGEFKIQDTDRHAFLVPGIAFAGHNRGKSVKGMALRQLAEGQTVSSCDGITFDIKLDFDHLIFVDDMLFHIKNGHQAFQDYKGKGKIYLVHYEFQESSSSSLSIRDEEGYEQSKKEQKDDNYGDTNKNENMNPVKECGDTYEELDEILKKFLASDLPLNEFDDEPKGFSEQLNEISPILDSAFAPKENQINITRDKASKKDHSFNLKKFFSYRDFF